MFCFWLGLFVCLSVCLSVRFLNIVNIWFGVNSLLGGRLRYILISLIMLCIGLMWGGLLPHWRESLDKKIIRYFSNKATISCTAFSRLHHRLQLVHNPTQRVVALVPHITSPISNKTWWRGVAWMKGRTHWILEWNQITGHIFFFTFYNIARGVGLGGGLSSPSALLVCWCVCLLLFGLQRPMQVFIRLTILYHS